MKYILITGVSTGIGRATVAEFVEKGYHVFGSLRKQSDADQLRTEFGDSFTPLLFDVTDQKAIETAAQQVSETIGDLGLTALINNAGMALSGPLMHVSVEDFRYQLEVNVVGVLAVTQAFLPLLGARNDCPHPPGKIINVSSIGGLVAMPFIGGYVASKHALEGFNNSLRMELQLYGIDVVSIQPGAVATPIWNRAPEIGNNGYEETNYGEAVDAFLVEFAEEGKKGFHPSVIGKKILHLVESKKPRYRNLISPTPFVDKFLLRYTPARWLDKMLGKQFKLNRLPEKKKEEVFS